MRPSILQERIPVEEVFQQLKCTKEGLSRKQVFEVLGIYVESSLMGHGDCCHYGYLFGKWKRMLISLSLSLSLCHSLEVVRLRLLLSPLVCTPSLEKPAHLVDSANNIGHFQTVLTAIGNFCICSIAVGMIIEIVVMYPIQHRRYRDGIDNLLVLLIGGIPIAMQTVLSVTMAVGSHRLSQQGAITKRMTAIEEMAGMDVLCSYKTGTLTLNKLTVDKTLIEVFTNNVDKDMVLLLGARASRVENQDAIDACIVGVLVDPKEARAGITEVHFFPFNPVDKRTAMTYMSLMVVGIESAKIIDPCNLLEDVKKKAHDIIAAFADRGLRSLAVARQTVPGKTKESSGGPW
ncbi:hypothetical protein CRYUN_Cryun37aG0024600 [Craigia yunnanensis]